MDDRAFRCVTQMVAGALAAFAMPASASISISYVHSDRLGTPQVLTDEQQRIVWRADYRPFGEAEIDEDPDGDGTAVQLQLRFPGQYQDPATGLYYNYYRDYDPSLGRYVQSDPLGLVTSQLWSLKTDDDPCNDFAINRGAVLGSAIGSGWSTAITRTAGMYSGTVAGAYSSTVLGWSPSVAASAIGTELGK